MLRNGALLDWRRGRRCTYTKALSIAHLRLLPLIAAAQLTANSWHIIRTAARNLKLLNAAAVRRFN